MGNDESHFKAEDTSCGHATSENNFAKTGLAKYLRRRKRLGLAKLPKSLRRGTSRHDTDEENAPKRGNLADPPVPLWRQVGVKQV